jgi:hypothetical protein
MVAVVVVGVECRDEERGLGLGLVGWSQGP